MRSTFRSPEGGSPTRLPRPGLPRATFSRVHYPTPVTESGIVRARKSEYAKSFAVEVATASAHVPREKVAFHCGKETDGNGGGGER